MGNGCLETRERECMLYSMNMKAKFYLLHSEEYSIWNSK